MIFTKLIQTRLICLHSCALFGPACQALISLKEALALHQLGHLAQAGLSQLKLIKATQQHHTAMLLLVAL